MDRPGTTPGTTPGATPGTGLLSPVRAGTATETGLVEPVLPRHTLRTPIGDTGAVLGHAAAALGKFATDVQTPARTELAATIRSAALQVPPPVLTLTHCAAGRRTGPRTRQGGRGSADRAGSRVPPRRCPHHRMTSVRRRPVADLPKGFQQ